MASPGQQRYGYHRTSSYPSRPERRTWDNITYAVDASQRARAEGESWVEISSQPSSSSLSSIDNEIITTGLRVQPLDLRRHRRATTTGAGASAPQGAVAGQKSASSQDEYDESSSEDDEHLITSTAEGLHFRPTGGRMSPRQRMVGMNLGGRGAGDVRFPSPSDEDGDEEDDEDEEGTALGITRPEDLFTPQPRTAGVGRTARGGQGEDYFSAQRPNAARRVSSTAHRAANDAALRASLTTLLSCAQAARSLPKPTNAPAPARGGGGNEMQEFRLLPEAEILGTAPVPTAPPPFTEQKSPSTRPRSSATASADEKEKSKEAKRRSAAKKKRASTHVHSTPAGAEVHQVLSRSQTVSPTLLTWIVSAGVVVFVSVVGFGAGYAMGFEAGKEEGRVLGLGCGKEVSGVRVRRFRWGTAA